MATLSVNYPTLLDLASRRDPNGAVAKIAELLSTTNEILEDMVWSEGNLITGNMTTIRTGLPAVAWRKMYGGVQPGKSLTAQITDNCGMLEAYAEIDVKTANLGGNAAAYRATEDTAYLESISQELATTLFYGDETLAAEKFTGLAPRFSDLSAGNAANIIDAGGIGVDNASIWLVGWGPMSIHGIIPKGSEAGIKHRDLGEVTLESAPNGGGRMQIYRTHYSLDAGLTLRDWRYVVRIANIDRSLLIADVTTGADLNDLMDTAVERLHSLNGVKPVFYMDRSVRSMLNKQSKNAVKNSTLTMVENQGRLVPHFQEIPIKRSDALSVDEARVT